MTITFRFHLPKIWIPRDLFKNLQTLESTAYL